MLTERHGPVYREVVQRMGRDGWLGVGWPVEYGGRGFGQIEQQIFVNEAARADVPLPAVTLQTVGPTLQGHGTPEQKEFFLPRILAGELHFAIGYTEPEAGTDLAALRTRAVRDGDEYVVNGQKTFTTGGHDADYVWLACRTGHRGARHKGISILIVDTADPGYSWTPIITCDGAHHVNATYYTDVRVPVGDAGGRGERGLAAGHHPAQPRAGHARPGRADGRPLRPGAAWAVSRRAARPRDRTPGAGRVPDGHAGQRAAQLAGGDAPSGGDRRRLGHQGLLLGALQRLGQLLETDVAGTATRRRSWLRWLDIQTKRNLVLTFGGGVNEIQRELIATAGLGLPRVPR